jgi:hypothetical protein
MMPSRKSRCVDGFHQFNGNIEALNRRFQRSYEENQAKVTSTPADDLCRTEPKLLRIHFETTCRVSLFRW